MVKIRLKRLGRKKKPFYRIIVIDGRARRQGASLAELGYYNPLSRELKLNKIEAQEWVGKGAILTPTVARLLDQAPETGELIVLERAQKERLSKKALDRQKQEADAKTRQEEEAKAAAAAKAAAEAEASATPEPAAEEPAAAETPAEEATAPETPAEEPAASETPAEEPAAAEAPAEEAAPEEA